MELGEVQVASFLAERQSTGQPFFRNGVPALVAFPPNCRSSHCYFRYDGDLSVDAIVDWMGTFVLDFPQILYYSRESLVKNFIANSGQHKIKVICFSRTGERAAPFLRKAAKDYWAYAAFALVLWREEESSMWWNLLGVESAPAIIFIKDPGMKPIVYHGHHSTSTVTFSFYQFFPLLMIILQFSYEVFFHRQFQQFMVCDYHGTEQASRSSPATQCKFIGAWL